jgi:hypothetical protein
MAFLALDAMDMREKSKGGNVSNLRALPRGVIVIVIIASSISIHLFVIPRPPARLATSIASKSI